MKLKDKILFPFRFLTIWGIFILLIIIAIIMPKKANTILDQWNHDYNR